MTWSRPDAARSTPVTDPTTPPDPAAAVAEVVEKSWFEARHGHRRPPQVLRETPERTWSILMRLLSGTRREYLGFEDPSVLVKSAWTDPMAARGSRALDSIFSRDVRVRMLTTPRGLRARGPECPGARLYTHRNARVVNDLPTRVWVFDRRTVIVPLEQADLTDGLLVLTDPVAVHTLVTTHRSLWTSGRAPCGPASESPVHDGLPPHLRDVVQMIGTGLTDEAAARRVGLSPRTYSRRVGELLELLGARSRFEAGAHAARRGWI